MLRTFVGFLGRSFLGGFLFVVVQEQLKGMDLRTVCSEMRVFQEKLHET